MIYKVIYFKIYFTRLGTDNSIVQTIDISPSLLNLCGIDLPDIKFDGRLWPVLEGTERDYALTESIYDSAYKLKLRNNTYIYDFEANILDNNIDIGKAKKQFWKISENSSFEKNQADQSNASFSKFDQHAISHIMSFSRQMRSYEYNH